MGFEGVAILLVGTTITFFLLYQLFRERESTDWSKIIDDNLANLFFGLGLIMIDVMLYTAWLYSAASGYAFADILKYVSITIIFLTIVVAIIMLVKLFFVFLHLFFKWAIERVGLMK